MDIRKERQMSVSTVEANKKNTLIKGMTEMPKGGGDDKEVEKMQSKSTVSRRL